MPKATIRIPTKEPYAYIEAMVEGTPEVILEAYNEFTSLIQASGASQGTSDGLPNKEWLKVVEHYLNTSELTGGAETWEKMNKYQRDWIQECKRALKRINSKEND